MLVTNDMLNDPRVARHAETLGNQGFSVTVVCPLTQRTKSREARNTYEIIRVRSGVFDHLAEVSNRRKRQIKSSQNNGPAIVLRIILALIRISALQLKLLRSAQKIHADVYCSNDLDTLLIGVICAGFERKLVYDSHELWTDMLIGVPPFIKAVLRQIEKHLIRRADAVMTVNEYIAKELKSRYAFDRTVHVVYSYPILPVGKKIGPRRTDPVKKVLYQGRYSPERGLENLVRASEYLLPDVELVLRGYGEIEKDLRRLASSHENVHFETPVKMEDLVEAAQNADVGVVSYMPTNLCNYLASPNKLFEYIHAGLAIAASDMPFLRKIVQEDGIGILFDPRNPRNIAEALNTITRPAELERCKNNVALASGKYTWGSESGKLVHMYRELTNQSGY
jgi:glycosyltransferase involved in cell wall biosynthesis